MGEVVELVTDLEAAQPPPGWTVEPAGSRWRAHRGWAPGRSPASLIEDRRADACRAAWRFEGGSRG